MRDDILRLQEPVHILVGTPGRILDLGSKGIADLRKCTIFVMDEADKLLSEEFTPVIEQVLALLPQERQVMLFSATFPWNVKDFSVSLAHSTAVQVSPGRDAHTGRRTDTWCNHTKST